MIIFFCRYLMVSMCTSVITGSDLVEVGEASATASKGVVSLSLR